MRVGFIRKGKRKREGTGKTRLSSTVCWSLTGSSTSQAVAESTFLVHSSFRAGNNKEVSVCKSIMMPNGTNGNTLGAQRSSGSCPDDERSGNMWLSPGEQERVDGIEGR